MLFIIKKLPGDDGEPDIGIPPVPDLWSWTLHKVVKGEVVEAVAKAPELYESEQECRSKIATAKIALKAARFAKVRVDGA
jgi:hypothetical protein